VIKQIHVREKDVQFMVMASASPDHVTACHDVLERYSRSRAKINVHSKLATPAAYIAFARCLSPVAASVSFAFSCVRNGDHEYRRQVRSDQRPEPPRRALRATRSASADQRPQIEKQWVAVGSTESHTDADGRLGSQ
jgi:hypothetical protein